MSEYIPVVRIFRHTACQRRARNVSETEGHLYMSIVVRKPVHPKNIARGLKFRICVVELLCYLYSENKGADQLRGYRVAGLRL